MKERLSGAGMAAEARTGREKERRGGDTTRSPPGSGDVLTLRTRSLIGDDLWRHSIFRPSSKGNRRNKYGHRVLPILGQDSREGGQMFSPIVRGASRTMSTPPAPDVEERFLAPATLPLPPSLPSFLSRSLSSFHESTVFLSTSRRPREVLGDLSRPSASRLWE